MLFSVWQNDPHWKLTGDRLSSLLADPPLYTVGRIPLDPRLATCLEGGESYVDAHVGAPAQTAMAEIVQKILLQTESGSDKQTQSTE